jgi:hypothetical protein
VTQHLAVPVITVSVVLHFDFRGKWRKIHRKFNMPTKPAKYEHLNFGKDKIRLQVTAVDHFMQDGGLAETVVVCDTNVHDVVLICREYQDWKECKPFPEEDLEKLAQLIHSSHRVVKRRPVSATDD